MSMRAVRHRHGSADSTGARPAPGVTAGAGAAGAGAAGAVAAGAAAAGAAGAAAGLAPGIKPEGMRAAKSPGNETCCGRGTGRNGKFGTFISPDGIGFCDAVAGAAAAAGAAAGAAGCGRVTDAVAAGAGVAGAAGAAACAPPSIDVRPCMSCDAAAGLVASCWRNGRPGKLGAGAGAGAAGSAAAVALSPSATPVAPAAAIMLVASIFLVNFMGFPIR